MAAITVFDLKTDGLSIYGLDKKKGTVLSRENIALSPGDVFPRDIKKSFGSSDDCYVSLPASLLNFRILELPFPDPKKIRDLLPYELDGLVLNGSASIVFDAFVIGGEAGAYKVLVAYLPKSALRDILTRLKAIDIDPKAVLSIELAHAVTLGSEREVADFLLGSSLLSEDERAKICAKQIKSPSFDFRRDEFAFTADTAKKDKALKTAAALLMLLVLVVLADASLNVVHLKRENRSIRDGIRSAYQGLFPNEKKVTDEVYQLKAHLKELREKEASFSGVSALRTLMDLTKISRPGLSLTEVTVERDLVLIKGECPSMTDVQRTKTELEPVFGEVNISDTRPSSQGRTQFTIRAKVKKG